MIYNPLMMILYYLWILITFREDKRTRKAKFFAEQDRNNNDDQMANESIQGMSLTTELCPSSLIVRSALKFQFRKFYWNLERQRIQLARTLPITLSKRGQLIPNRVKLIPFLTENINLFDNNNDYLNFETISLRSLIKEGRYLVHDQKDFMFYMMNK